MFNIILCPFLLRTEKEIMFKSLNTLQISTIPVAKAREEEKYTHKTDQSPLLPLLILIRISIIIRLLTKKNVICWGKVCWYALVDSMVKGKNWNLHRSFCVKWERFAVKIHVFQPGRHSRSENYLFDMNETLKSCCRLSCGLH